MLKKSTCKIYIYVRETRQEDDHAEVLGVDGRFILKESLRIDGVRMLIGVRCLIPKSCGNTMWRVCIFL